MVSYILYNYMLFNTIIAWYWPGQVPMTTSSTGNTGGLFYNRIHFFTKGYRKHFFKGDSLFKSHFYTHWVTFLLLFQNGMFYHLIHISGEPRVYLSHLRHISGKSQAYQISMAYIRKIQGKSQAGISQANLRQHI